MNLDDEQLRMLGRAKKAGGHLAPDDLDDDELAAVRHLVYLGMLDRQRSNGVVHRYVLTPAGGQALNHRHP